MKTSQIIYIFFVTTILSGLVILGAIYKSEWISYGLGSWGRIVHSASSLSLFFILFMLLASSFLRNENRAKIGGILICLSLTLLSLHLGLSFHWEFRVHAHIAKMLALPSILETKDNMSQEVQHLNGVLRIPTDEKLLLLFHVFLTPLALGVALLICFNKKIRSKSERLQKIFRPFFAKSNF